MSREPRWNVWRVTYATYEEQQRDGDIKPVLVARGLTFKEADQMVRDKGFGYCMKEDSP